MRWPCGSAVLALALIPALAGCGQDAANQPADGPPLDLVVGDLVPLSGELAASGRSGRRAAKLAFEQIEAAIAETGVDHAVKLIHADTGTGARSAVRAGRRAVSAASSCIAGPWSSVAALALARALAGDDAPLQISPVSGSGELAELDDGGLVNSTALPDSAGGAALADAIARRLGAAEGRTVRLAASAGTKRNLANAGPSTDAEAFTRQWRDRGGEIVKQVFYSQGRRRYNDAATQLVTRSSDATAVLDSGRSFAGFVGALERTGKWNPAASWGFGGLYATRLATAFRDPSAIDGFRVLTPVATGPRPAVRGFDQLFGTSRRTDSGSLALAAQSFDAVILCYLSAVAAGSTDGTEMASTLADLSGPGGSRYTWRRLPEAIEALLNGEDIDYVGASGPVDLDEHGSPSSGAYDILRFQGGVARQVGRVLVPAPN